MLEHYISCRDVRRPSAVGAVAEARFEANSQASLIQTQITRTARKWALEAPRGTSRRRVIGGHRSCSSQERRCQFPPTLRFAPDSLQTVSFRNLENGVVASPPVQTRTSMSSQVPVSMIRPILVPPSFRSSNSENSPCSQSNDRRNPATRPVYGITPEVPALVVRYLATFATPCPVILIGSP